MLPSKFCELAQFPDRWQEKHLQYYLAERLKTLGYVAHRERPANGGFADIVTNWQDGAIIEVKKYLNRETIYQAFGQLKLYGLNNKHKLIVMGFLTPNADEQKGALSTASMIEQDSRTQVIFVNLEEEWQPRYFVSRSWFNFKLPTLPKIPTLSWRSLWNLGLSHPIPWILAIAILMGVIPYIPIQQNQQSHQK